MPGFGKDCGIVLILWQVCPPADGLIILDSSLGFGAITLVTLDPAVADENKATQLTPSLNLYNPQNGFHAPTGGTYSSAFIQNYTAAQAKRMEKLIQTAVGRLAILNAGNGESETTSPSISREVTSAILRCGALISMCGHPRTIPTGL